MEISSRRYAPEVYPAGEIDVCENLDIVRLRWLVALLSPVYVQWCGLALKGRFGAKSTSSPAAARIKSWLSGTPPLPNPLTLFL
jgi:hypothetical protein